MKEFDVSRLTDEDVMAQLNSNTPLNRARRVFSGEVGRFEQAYMNADAQGRSISPIESRRMEFEAVQRIAEALAPKEES